MMTRFTAYNTNYQFNNSELAELNAAFAEAIAAYRDYYDAADENSMEWKSLEDFVSEQLLAEYNVSACHK